MWDDGGEQRGWGSSIIPDTSLLMIAKEQFEHYNDRTQLAYFLSTDLYSWVD